MKILVLGAGRMGHGAVHDLVHNSSDVDSVTVADFHLDKAGSVAARSAVRESMQGRSMRRNMMRRWI